MLVGGFVSLLYSTDSPSVEIVSVAETLSEEDVRAAEGLAVLHGVSQ